MNIFKEALNDISNQFTTYFKWAISGFIDFIFLALWVFFQSIFETTIVKRFELSGLDQWMLIIIQVLFACMTLYPIVIYIYEDFSILIHRSRQKISNAKKAVNDENK